MQLGKRGLDGLIKHNIYGTGSEQFGLRKITEFPDRLSN